MFVPDVPVTQTCYSQIIADIPIIDKHRGYRTLLSLLALSGMRDEEVFKETGKHIVPVSYQLVQLAAGTDERVSAGSTLTDFQQKACPGIIIHPYSKAHGKCRRVEVPPSLLYYLTLNQERGAEVISMATKHIWTANHSSYLRRKMVASAKEQMVGHELEQQVNYLQGIDPRHFAPAKTNLDYAWLLANQLPDDGAKLYATNLLNQIERMPGMAPVYTPGRHTGRVFSGSPFHRSKTEIRRALHPDYIELDLTCAHLAIMAAVLKASKALAYITELKGQSPWSDLGENLSLDRDLVKALIYPFAYGASPHTMMKEAGICPADLRNVMRHFLFEELLQLRDAYLAKLRLDGYGVDVITGEKIYLNLDHKHPELSVFSQIMQRLEVALIKPCFDILPQLKAIADVDIILFQHDGFTLNVVARQRRPQVIALLQLAVQQRAEELGIPTSLVIKLY